MSPNPEAGAAHSRRWLYGGYALIGLLLLGRWLYLASGVIELSEDEAYQWLWSNHLALSYFSKPPLIAYAQWLGTNLFGDTEFGVRCLSPLLAAIGSLVALRFFARHVNARAGFWLVAAANVTPLLAVGSTLMTVDPLLVFFWTLAMFSGWRAAQPDGRLWHWMLVGVWMGLAFLSKYTALFQWLCWALFFWLWKPARVHLRKPGPYVALLINALATLPVLIWNAQHDWITVAHVANNADAGQGWAWDVRALAEFLGGTAGLMHPVFYVGIVWACCGIWKKRQPLALFFFAMGAPVYVVYAIYSLHSSGELNWIAASILPLLCLMVVYWNERMTERPQGIRRTLGWSIAIGAVAVVFLHDTALLEKLTGRTIPARTDPMRRVRGWKEMAGIVAYQRQLLEREGKSTFIITSHYGSAGLLSFYLPEARSMVQATPLVYYRTRSRPVNQFYFWPGYVRTRQGQNAIYVVEKDKPTRPPAELLQEFESVTELGHFPVARDGKIFHYVQLFACRNLLR